MNERFVGAVFCENHHVFDSPHPYSYRQGVGISTNDMGDRQVAQSSEKEMSLAVMPPSLRGKHAGGTHTAGGANGLRPRSPLQSKSPELLPLVCRLLSPRQAKAACLWPRPTTRHVDSARFHLARPNYQRRDAKCVIVCKKYVILCTKMCHCVQEVCHSVQEVGCTVRPWHTCGRLSRRLMTPGVAFWSPQLSWAVVCPSQ